MAAQEYDLLIVSDLHLSEGRDAKSKKLSLIEDFLFDEEFARFLGYHMRSSASKTARKWRLIINGDFFDFLQVVSTEIDQRFLDYLHVTTHEQADQQLRASAEHPEYGFGTGAKEAVFKIWKIMEGHWVFFESLADFIVAGNAVCIGRGNHDVELIYPEVRAAFVAKLRKIYEAKLMRQRLPQNEQLTLLTQFDAACQTGAIEFLDWFYYETELWVEHGNQYDELNSFRYWLAPYLPESKHVACEHRGEIDLPWGSFFVRYLFNKIEMKEPFADNIKPTTRFVSWLLKAHPFLALHFMFHDGSYMLGKIARAWRSTPAEAYVEQQRQHRQGLAMLARESGAPERTLAELDAQRAPNILKEPYGRWKIYGSLTRHWRLTLALFAAVLVVLSTAAILVLYGVAQPIIPVTVRQALAQARSLIAAMPVVGATLRVLQGVVFAGLILALAFALVRALRSGRPVGPCYLAEQARRIHKALGVRYVVMGHTHDTDLQQDPTGGEYFNTGTWTKVFSEEERLIRDENELVFLRGTRASGQLKMELMKWTDGAGEPRLVKLFTDQSSQLHKASAGAPESRVRATTMNG